MLLRDPDWNKTANARVPATRSACQKKKKNARANALRANSDREMDVLKKLSFLEGHGDCCFLLFLFFTREVKG